ncbi:MAG: ATP-binding protein, partial [Chitinispirillia bacterium]|nr:ATP-binding protein [Chitinispirillia bacterium]
FPKYNEMFGFTRDDVELIMAEAGINRDLIKVDMEAYYNGYAFSEYAGNKVYNSQMILYLFNMVMQLGEQPKQIVDTNLKTDYGRLRRLADGEGNRQKLLQIILNGKIAVSIKEKFSVDDLQNEDYFVSLLFYLGMLTIEPGEEQIYLKIPNYSIKTLYWEYMAEYLKNTEEGVIDSGRLEETVRNLACDGDMMPFMNYFSESFLKRMSNRDLQKFDEKYIKAMMLTLLFTSPLYLPVSEDETINGYTDVYLQKHPAKRAVKYEYVFEIKYAKTGAAAAEIAAKFAEAGAQIEKYKQDPRFAGRGDIKFAALVFMGKGDLEVRR